VPGITNSYIKTGAPTITGAAEPNSTVTIYDNGVAIGTTTADASGNYSYTASLTDGAHSLTATATDAAGNVSPASGATSFTVDTSVPTAPGAPTVPGLTDGYSKTGALTITGTAEPGSTVTIYDNGVAIGTTTADASGNYSYTASLTDGAHSLTATSTDAAGNVSPAGNATGFTIDTSTPSAPSVPTVPGLTNGYSKTGNVTVTGTAEPGSTITIYDNGVAIGTTTADASGNYSYTASLGDGSHSLSATSTDAAGNVSPASGAAAFTVQAEAPAVTITAPSATVTALFTATISFSQPVTGFDMNGVSATNATLSNFVQVNDTVYTVVVTPAGGGGQVSLSVAANVAINQAGTGNLASNVLDLNATITELVDKVYPVPAKTVLHIHFAGIPPTEGRIMLIDMAGQRVYDQQAAISSEEMTINVSEFSSGVYVLKVIAGDYNYQRKIIIQHQ
jgi:outer membrane usher protein FimD/PapC